MNPPDLKQRLETAIARWDQAEEKRHMRSAHGWHNPYALGIALMRLDEALAAIANGASVETTLRANFNDRLLTALLRASI